MIFVFNVLGWMAMAIGGLSSGFTLFSRTGPGPISSAEMYARIAVAMPGFGLMFVGLLLFAIAGVLSRLDKIVANTAATTTATAALIERGAGRQEPRF